MKWLFAMTAVAALTAASATAAERVSQVVLGIHGGTGLAKKDMTPELDRQLRAGLEAALKAGHAALQKPGATSLDAVEAAIRVLEDDPHFNAGRGAVFTHEGRNELDASIMDGKTKAAGAVAGVTTVKNPITAARAVMEKSAHVMLIGRGAEAFAERQGLEIVNPVYFWTEPRWKQLLQQLQAAEKQAQSGLPPQRERYHELGTVGAVAVDAAGNIAAGTSTGGMSNKAFGRVGDSPIIGAGTYADNQGCAVSCTGHGEYFIRFSVAHDIVSLVKYKRLSVQAAADELIQNQLKPIGGDGAVIALDPKGNFAMSYNSDGLYRGYVTRDGKMKVMLYED